MPRIVDGDNLLGTWPGRLRSDRERRTLAREIATLALRERRRVVVVFDGVAPPDLRPGSDLLFAGPARSADDAILETLRGETDRRGWTVVTNDRSLGDQCRYLGARVERCDVFRERLVSARGPEKPDGRDEIDFWSGVFRDE